MLKMSIHRDEPLLVLGGSVILTLVQGGGQKTDVLVEGPGSVYRANALRNMLGPEKAEKLIATLRQTPPPGIARKRVAR
jgi:hypothetical protein